MNKLFISLVISLLLYTTEVSAALKDTIAAIKPSVVGVGIYTPTGRPKNILRGTGFVVGDGHYIVTNDHVVPNELNSELKQKIAVFIGQGKQTKVRLAEVIAESDRYDLAILKISGPALPAVNLADDGYYQEGSYIAFTGFPIGAVLGLYPVTHRGIISSITPTVIPAVDTRQLTVSMIKLMKNPYLVYQLDATAYPGNSGSALYDAETGKVIGIINKVFVQQSKEKVLEKPSGITYAIPVKHLRALLKQNNIKLN